MNYNQALHFINSRELFGIKLGLKNIKNLLKKLGNPEKELRVIHVAGTNGKGSSCAMLCSILQDAGYRVGFYSSPHLKTINERFRVNDKLISNKDFIELIKVVKPLVKEETYFEVLTAIAFLYFKQKKADFVILEVGMGGRLDATNVIEAPLLSIITNIDYEHCDYLGNTIKKIAKEKAGIIKEKSIVLTGARGDAYKIINKIAENKRALLFKNKKYNYKTNLLGGFQKINLDIAVSAINLLKRYHKVKVSNKNIVNGLGNVYWPGRFEFLKPNLLIDCAHNPNGIKVLVKDVNNLLKNNQFKDYQYKNSLKNNINIKDLIKKISLNKKTIINNINNKFKNTKKSKIFCVPEISDFCEFNRRNLFKNNYYNAFGKSHKSQSDLTYPEKEKLGKRKRKIKGVILILGIVDDKDYKTMIKEIMKIKNIKNIILTKADTKRAIKPLVLAKEIKKYNKCFLIIKKVKDAVKYALRTAKNGDLILVTGSIYVVGEV